MHNKFDEPMFYLSESKNIDDEVEKLFQYYRNSGFPNYKKTDYSLLKEYTKLKEYSEHTLLEDDIIHQSIIGLGILWSYFSHWIDIKCGSEKFSLGELWNDDQSLRKLIRKTYVWKLKHHELHWTTNRIRQNAKVFLSGQSVSNFRPTVSKFLYQTYGQCGRVLDMSSGFGGRLFGFYASDCKEYIGFEPSSKTYNGLCNLAEDLSVIVPAKKYKIIKDGSENYYSEYKDSIDFCFTSPPYFDTEKYSDEQTQSYIRYPSLDLWIKDFFLKTISNCYSYTRPGGYLGINIVSKIKNVSIEDRLMAHARKLGYTHIRTYRMELSSVSKTQSRKYEPIFIFKKI